MKTPYKLNNHASADTLQRALTHALPSLLPSLRVARMQRAGGRGSADLAADVVTPLGRRRRLWVEVAAAPIPGRIREPLRHLKASARPPGAYPVLASRFLSPRVRQICREEGVGYVDLAGNCFLQFDGIHVEKIVDRNPFPTRGRPASLFAPVSSRILRALLEEPDRAWRVNELAAAAEVSLGHTSNVTRRLLDEEYAAVSQRRLRLVHPAQLLEAWREQPAPAEPVFAYYSFEADVLRRAAQWAAAAHAYGWRYAVTSFAAASLVAPFVHGIQTLQGYVDDEAAVASWVQALDLRPVEQGANVLLVVPPDRGVFYRSQTVNGVTLVGTIQLYLDLYRDPGRGREQADFLRQQRLGF